MKNKVVRNLALFATVFAVVVVVLGAFTRLSDAGLGCPDWPGCYGFIHIPTKSHHIDKANEAFPEQPYEFEKAWPEMVHRYFAGTLGLLVLALAIISWRNKQKFTLKHSSFLLLLVVFQAALGMWTVTMKLHPSIVMLHLLGGLTTLSLLASLTIRYHFNDKPPLDYATANKFKSVVVFTLFVLVLQVALGGWTSANYAAMVCHELPICQGNWLANSDFIAGFQLWGREADTYEFGILDQNSRIAIHAAHRVGAIIASVTLLFLIFKLLKQSASVLLKRMAIILLFLLITQIVLGVNNIVFKLPLFNAVAHNAVGGFLIVSLTVLITLIFTAQSSTNGESHG
ncbi:COX15/CtaA family protein [Aliikangiella sp. IMCC44359]|uniref:COX15/CtaA family protein n=1 Tax=Aliikangiella sp. IMCC44359 TaxID=3459125 RepID=UPI00403B07C3